MQRTDSSTAPNGDADPQALERLRGEAQEIASTTRRQMYVVIFTGFFLMLTLAGSDDRLVRADASISWPLIHTEVQLSTFLLYAPIALIGLLIYLHIFVERLRELEGIGVRAPGTFIFSMSNRFAKALSELMLYAFVPVVLAYFCWRAVVREEAEMLSVVALVATFACAGLYWVRQRGTDDLVRRRIAAGVLVTLTLATFAGAIVLAIHGRDPFLRLRGLDLVRADLGVSEETPHVRLNETDLRHSNMARARLSGADLRGADLRRADASLADLALSEDDRALRGVSETDLTRARLDGTKLAEADLRGAAFRCASMQGADMRQARVAGADFYGADLRGATMLRLDARDGDAEPEPEVVGSGRDLLQIEDATPGPDASPRARGGANFQEADLRGARLGRAWLPNANFVQADLAGADLTLALLQSASFANANLSGATLAHVDLSTVDLRGADLTGADLTRAKNFEADAHPGVRICETRIPGGDMSSVSCDRRPFQRGERPFC